MIEFSYAINSQPVDRLLAGFEEELLRAIGGKLEHEQALENVQDSFDYTFHIGDGKSVLPHFESADVHCSQPGDLR